MSAPNRRSLSLLVALVAAALLSAPGLLMAQQSSPFQPGGQQEADDEESPFLRFDSHDVERVRPSTLPDIGPLLPSRTSRRGLDDLPRVMTSDRLRDISTQVNASTVSIYAVHRPPPPYRQTDMVYRGFALWISPGPGEEPLLIATGDWLDGAEKIYAIGGERRPGGTAAHLDTSSSASIDISEAIVGNDFLRRYRNQLVELEVKTKDTFVNLVHLVPDESSSRHELDRPEQGFLLHDMDEAMPHSLFGLSSTAGAVSPVSYEDSQSLPADYSFYFLTTSSAILGAPIVGPEGHLLGMAALPYPPDPQFSLAIPPGGLHYFLDQLTGTDDD